MTLNMQQKIGAWSGICLLITAGVIIFYSAITLNNQAKSARAESIENARVLAGETVSITIAASDINDVAEMTVHVGDELLDTLPITKGPIVTVAATWEAAGNGLVVMTITAVNAKGINIAIEHPA